MRRPAFGIVLLFALVLTAFVFQLYRPSLHNPLVWDDVLHVPAMQSAPLSAAWARAPGQYRRPLVLLSYALQSRGGEASPFALHAANVSLHVVNAVLLLALVLRLGVAAPVAFAGALVFAAHPLCSAAVAYVSGRTDLLAVMFTLLALHCLGPSAFARVAAIATPATYARTAVIATPATYARAAAIAVFVACAALAKESGLLAGPLVCALWWLGSAGPGLAMRARSLMPTSVRPVPVIPTAALATTLLMAVVIAPPALLDSVSLSPGVRLRAAGAAVRTYATLLAAPAGLHLDRLAAVDGWTDTALGASAAIAIVAAVIAFTRRPTRLRFAWAALAIVSLPASNLLPIHPSIADRYAFTGEQLAYAPLAVLGPLAAVGVAGLVDALRKRVTGRDPARPRITARSVGVGDVAVSAVVLASAFAVAAVWSRQTLARQRDLADAETTYRATLARSPSPRACFNLGVTMLERGRANEAARVYERCAELAPSDAAVLVQLGVAYQRAGRREDAERAYARALELNPRDPYAWSNYASLQASAGLYAEARGKWTRALELQAGFAPALEGLAKLREVEGEASERSPRALPPPS